MPEEGDKDKPGRSVPFLILKSFAGTELGFFGLSQEREYKEALEAFNDKNKEKVQLITKLMEVGDAVLSLFVYMLVQGCAFWRTIPVILMTYILMDCYS